MPIYEFKCTECDQTATIAASIKTEPSVPVCSACTVTMVRVYGVAAVTFKGSGFYQTDKGK
jgi:putative FmdB family regulatory protein